MPSLTKNREVFNSVANADVVSSSAPNGDVGVSKTVGERGFFIKSQTTFALWFKDGSGVWNISNNNATTGFYEWGANQSFYIQSDSNASFFVFKRKVIPTPRANVVRANKTIRNRAFDTATSHTNIASSWTTSGHRGVPYSIGLFGVDGVGTYLQAPPSGQREGKFLGWDDNGDLGWIIPPTVTVDVMGETDGIENESALEGGAYFSNTGAVILDGVDSYVQTDDNYHFPDQFQLGANIKPTNLDDEFQTIAGTRNFDGSANGFILEIKDGMLRATGPQSDNFVLDAPIPDDIDMEDGEYHEIKLKWIKDDELTIFLDGEPIGTHTPSGEVRGGTEDMEIGRNPKNENMHFEGEIDGVTVTNEVQTEEEILNEFIAKVLGNTPSPVDYDSIEDLQSTTMVNGASLVNGYLTLDGSNYAQADSNHHYGDFITATAWFRTVKHESGFGVLFSSRKWNGSGNGFALAIKDGGLHLHHPQTNNTHIEPTFDHVDLSDGEWHQAVLRWKANEDLSAFVDGVKVGSLVPAGGINAGAFDLLIGTEPHGFTGMFVGHIDGVKVENVYKSDNEIMSEFTGNPILTLLGNNPMGAFKAPYVDPGASAVDHPDGDLTAQVTSDWDAVVGANPAMGDYVVTYSVTDSDGNQNTLTRNVTIGDGLEDIATLQNGATRPSGDLVLDGVNDYGSIPSSNEYDLDGGDMTVRCWFKTDSALGGGRGLITKGHGSAAWKGWGLYLHDANGLAFNMWSSAGGGGGNRSNLMGSPSDWNVGEWNHIALVMRTTDTWKLYINGQLLNEFTPASITTSTDAELRIGATKIVNNNSFGHPFDGEIKKALIDKSALSAADILAEYNEGAPPEITLLGDNPYKLSSLEDTDPGATAVDPTDGDVTANITSNWDAIVGDGLINGIHNITYSVTDSDGNSKSATREIWNGTIEDWTSTSLSGDASRADGVLTLGGNGYAVANSNHHYDDYFYFDAWIRTDSLVAGNSSNWSGMVVLASTRNWNGNYNGFTIGISADKFNMHVPYNNNVYNFDISGHDINDNQWHYIGIKFVNTGETTLFIDGQNVQSITHAGGNAIGGTQNLNIGRDPRSGNYRFAGDVNHVSITNESPTDITDRYLANAPATITLLGDSPMNVTAIPVTDPGATADDPDTGDISAGITSDWDAVVGDNPINGSYSVTYTVTSSRGDVVTRTRSVEVAVVAVYADNVFIEEWPFRATPIGTINEGIIALNGDEASVDSSHTITIPGSEFSHITDTYTISFWYKKPSGTGVGTFFTGGGIQLWTQHGQGTSLRMHTGIGAINLKREGAFGHTSNWTHYAIVVQTDESDNSSMKFYRNGALFTNAIDAHTNTWTKNGDLDWSGDVVLNTEYNMELDSFEIVDYALSETGVANVHAAGRGTAMGDVVQSYDPVVYNLTHEPILSTAAATVTANRSNTDLYSFNAWMNSNHAPLSNPCNDKYTLSAWFKVAGGFGPLLVTHYDAQTTGIWLEVLNEGLKYGTPNGTQTTYNWPVNKDTSMTDGEWHNIVATFDHSAGTRTLYLDGVRLVGGDDTFTPDSGNPNNEHLLFYKRWGPQQSYGYQGTPGRYGNIHLVNYVLTDSQAADIYNAGYLGITIEDGNVPSAPAGYVEDVEDGNGTIVATNNWDAIIGASPAAGNYTVTYSATDSHGSTTDLDVAVVVLEQEAIPLLNPNLYFDGSSLDAIVGNNSLVLAANTSIDSSNGKYGNNSYSYGATGDKLPITFENSVDITSGTYTFSMWFYNARDTSDYRVVLRQVATGMPVNTRRLPILIGPNNELGHQLQGTLTWTGYDMTPHIAQNTWTHLAVVADGTDSKYYINGVFVGTAAGVIETAITEFGSYSGNNGEATFAEGLDEVAYWARALSDDEIYTIGATDLPLLEIDTLLTAPPPTVITANLEESYPDAQGVSQPVTVHENGQLIDGIYADSADGEDHVSGVFTDNLRPVAEDVSFSFSAFYRTHPDSNTGSNTSTHHLFDCQDSNNNAGWKLYVNPHFDTRWSFGLETNGLTLFNTGHIDPLDAYTGKFHHVAFTSQDGVIKVYYNGVLVHTENGATFLPDVPAHGEYRIGNDFISRFATDKVTIYKNHVLTQEEIAALQDEKAQLDIDYSYINPDALLPIPTMYFDGSTEESQNGDYLLTPSAISNFLSTSNGKYGNNSFFYDVSGQNKAARLSPQIGLSNDHTFSFWFYNMRPGTGTHKNILSISNTDGGTPAGHVAYVHQGNGLLRQHVGSTKETGYNIVNAGLAADTWHNMVIVAEGGGTTMYINGVQVGNKTNATASSLFLQDIGGIVNHNQTFAEGIDEIAYWPVALTIEQIDNIYNSELPLSDLNSWEDTSVIDFGNPSSIFDGSSLVASDGTTISTSDNGVVSTDSVTFNGQNVLDYTNSNQEVNITPAYDCTSGVYSFSHWFKNMPNERFQTFARTSSPDESIIQIFDGNLRIRQSNVTHTGPNVAAYKGLNTWTHCAVVADGSDSKIYFIGQLVHTFTGVVANDLINILGNDPWSQGLQKWADYIADLRYWDGFVLTDANVLELYNTSVPPTPPLEESADLTLHNGATLTDGVFEFDATQASYAMIPHSEDLEVGGTDTTMHLWFYPTSNNFPGGNTQTFLSKLNNGSPDYAGYHIGFADRKHPAQASGDTGIKVWSCAGAGSGGNNNNIFRVTGGVTLNQWHHFAISFNESNNVHTCYYDGQPIGTWTLALPGGAANIDLKIGGGLTVGESFDGKLKEVYIEKSLLSDAEILAIYNDG